MHIGNEKRSGLGARALRITLAGIVIGAACLTAQTSDWQEDLGEVSSYTGVILGPLGAHPLVGAATGISVSKYALALIDASFMPLGGNTLVRFPNVTSASHLYDFDFSIQFRVPVKKHWAPYGLLGSALLYNTYHLQSVHDQSVVYLSGQSVVKAGFEAGGGVRYNVNEAWGAKCEYRYTVSTQNFSRIQVGVFYQFSGSWPFVHSSGRRRVPLAY